MTPATILAHGLIALFVIGLALLLPALFLDVMTMPVADLEEDSL